MTEEKLFFPSMLNILCALVFREFYEVLFLSLGALFAFCIRSLRSIAATNMVSSLRAEARKEISSNFSSGGNANIILFISSIPEYTENTVGVGSPISQLLRFLVLHLVQILFGRKTYIFRSTLSPQLQCKALICSIMRIIISVKLI